MVLFWRDPLTGGVKCRWGMRTTSSAIAERPCNTSCHWSHSRSFEMTLLSREWVPTSISLKLCLYLVPFLRYSASKNGMTLKLGIGVIQCRWKWRHSIDHIRLTIGRPSIALCCTIWDIWCWIIVTLKSGLPVTEGHSNWYHLKTWLQFPIRLA